MYLHLHGRSLISAIQNISSTAFTVNLRWAAEVVHLRKGGCGIRYERGYKSSFEEEKLT